MLWTTGEETWKPLKWIGAQDPITIAKYAKEHNLLDEAGWKGNPSIKSIKTCMFLFELNKLVLWMADVGNAFLEAMTKEMLYIVAGPESRPLEGHILIVDKALYGLRSSGAQGVERLADLL